MLCSVCCHIADEKPFIFHNVNLTKLILTVNVYSVVIDLTQKFVRVKSVSKIT